MMDANQDGGTSHAWERGQLGGTNHEQRVNASDSSDDTRTNHEQRVNAVDDTRTNHEQRVSASHDTWHLEP
jgi:hypothetical protein